MTLRSRLALAFLLVVMLPLVVGTALLLNAVQPAVRAREDAGLVAAAGLSSLAVDTTCSRAVMAAGAAARASTSGTDPSRADVQRAVDALVADRVADGVRVRDASGAVLAAAGVLPDRVLDCAGRDGGAQVSGSFLGARVGLRTAAGGAGSVEVALRLEPLLRSLAGGAGATTGVVGDGGEVLSSSGPLDAGLVTRAVAAKGRVVRDDRRAAVVDARGLLRVVVVETLPPSVSLLPRAVGVLVGAALLATLIAVLLARATTRPLTELGDAAGRIADGDLSTTVEVHGRDEVAGLAASFDHMTERLRRYVGALEASRDELQAGLARLGDTLASTHDLDRILGVVLESAVVAARASGGLVLLLAPGSEELVLAAAEGVGTAPGTRLPVADGVLADVVRSGAPRSGRTGPGGLVQGEGEPAARSLLCVPLTSGGPVIGVLALLDRRDAEAFDAGDLAAVQTLARQATVAVDNVLLHQDLQRMAVTDPLTGLGNQRQATLTIGREVERAARFGRPLGILMLDLDLFKRVNDTYGHPRGDAVLVEFAARVRGQVRDVDTVARVGGEEVVVVLPETDVDGAARTAERICAAVRSRPFGGPGDEPLRVTVSVGAAVFPRHGETPAALLAAADTALYAAKHAGRDTWRVADERAGARRPRAGAAD